MIHTTSINENDLIFVEGLFCRTRIKGRKPNPATQTEKKLAKDREQKPLSPSGKNNGS